MRVADGGPAVTVDGVIVIGGEANAFGESERGAGLLCPSSTAIRISNAKFARHGGSTIDAYDAELRNVIVEDNHSYRQAYAVRLSNIFVPAIVEGCTFRRNFGYAMETNEIIIENSVFSENKGKYFTGGVEAGHAEVRNCIFERNTAGALKAFTAVISESVFRENYGLFEASISTSLGAVFSNCLIQGNRSGGGRLLSRCGY